MKPKDTMHYGFDYKQKELFTRPDEIDRVNDSLILTEDNSDTNEVL